MGDKRFKEWARRLDRCVYCGKPMRRHVLGAAVCPKHASLPKHDPVYNVPDQWTDAR